MELCWVLARSVVSTKMDAVSGGRGMAREMEGRGLGCCDGVVGF